MWIGTSGGLNKVIRKDNHFHDIDKDNELEFYSYHINDGLPSEVIVGIVEDNIGNLWLSTANGVSKFNVSDISFTNYTESDGLQSDEFWHNAYFKDQNGRIYFGGNNGFNVFDPDSIKENPILPQVVFTDIKIFNKSVKIGEEINGDVIISKSISETSQIVLSHKNNILSLEFAALHYTEPDKNRYAYKMEGFDKEWIETSADLRFATYTNLPARKYTFKVKASNSDGVWNEEGTSLKIIVTPPFWRTIWFRFSMIALTILGAYMVHFIRVRNIVAYGRKLEGLANALKESNKDLENFAYIIAHDLKAPLRGINQLAEWTLKDSYKTLDKNGKNNLSMLRARTTHINNMIQGILEYSRLVRIEGEAENIDLNNLLREAIDSLEPPDNIKIKVENKLPEYTADKRHLTLLFENLLSNAIKFMDKPKGLIKVSCVEEDSNWKFSISDNGPGIEEKYFEKIFKIFQTLEHRKTYKNTGIGLTIAKKIIDLYKGRIWVESEIGKGTTFYFTLPKQ
jgi:signal transduction histidine kinase